MPMRARGGSITILSKPLARTNALTAAILGPCKRFSASSGASGLRMPSPPGGSWKSVGITILMRSGSTHTEAPELDCLGDRLEADPAARVARQSETQHAEVEILLDVGRIDHRDHRGGEHLLALVRQGRGLAAMIVARQRDDAAMRRGAGGIAVLQHVHRAVDTWALAVPDREHAIDGGAGEQVDLLRAPHRCRRQVLVEARLEVDVVLLQVTLRGPQRVVVHAQRRAAIAGDEAAGIEAGGKVALALHHGQAHQRLDAGEVDATLVESVAVFQRVVAENEGNGNGAHRGRPSGSGGVNGRLSGPSIAGRTAPGKGRTSPRPGRISRPH